MMKIKLTPLLFTAVLLIGGSLVLATEEKDSQSTFFAPESTTPVGLKTVSTTNGDNGKVFYVVSGAKIIFNDYNFDAKSSPNSNIDRQVVNQHGVLISVSLPKINPIPYPNETYSYCTYEYILTRDKTTTLGNQPSKFYFNSNGKETLFTVYVVE